MTQFTRNPYISPIPGDKFVFGPRTWRVVHVLCGEDRTPYELVSMSNEGNHWRTPWWQFKLHLRCRANYVVRKGETSQWRNPWSNPIRGDLFRSEQEKIEVLTVLTLPHYDTPIVAFAFRGHSSDDVPVSPKTRAKMMTNEGPYRHEELSLREFMRRVRGWDHVAAEEELS